ncbi:MAG: hypothetical protein IT435_09395 [Phycisphaerales bacterium]|nr:hypothetical protein [Phycisphaerales bacterium]
MNGWVRTPLAGSVVPTPAKSSFDSRYDGGMICRIEGMLESITGIAAIVQPGAGPGGGAGGGGGGGGGGIAYEVLLPAYLARKLADRTGERISLLTHQYLEAQGQGASFIPRLIGFETALDRRFFELFTTVKGIGNRKALRALEIEPARFARAITEKNTRALVELPEIGKRLAETIIAELHGKVDVYLASGEIAELKTGLDGSTPTTLPPAQREAVEALVALGETRADAIRRVEQAVAAHGVKIKTADEVLEAVYGGKR